MQSASKGRLEFTPARAPSLPCPFFCVSEGQTLPAGPCRRGDNSPILPLDPSRCSHPTDFPSTQQYLQAGTCEGDAGVGRVPCHAREGKSSLCAQKPGKSTFFQSSA